MNDEQACRQAYDDFYHKVRAEVGYDHWAAIWRFIRKRRGEPVDLDRYDAGFFGGQDGMPAYVWHDIIRAELDRAYDFYMDQLDRAAPQPSEIAHERRLREQAENRCVAVEDQREALPKPQDQWGVK